MVEHIVPAMDIMSNQLTNSITLFLMSQKGYEVLKNIVSSGHKSMISVVYSSRDSQIENDYYQEIKRICHENGIDFRDRKDGVISIDNYALAISWRWLIQAEEKKLIVFHDSVLPRYRGFSPLPSCLINGEKEIGVTALYAGQLYDSGEIILQDKVAVDYPMKIADAIELIIPCYTKLVLKILEFISIGKEIASTPQNEEEATYSIWRDEKDYLIDWNQDSKQIKRFVDAVGYPYKGSSSFIEGSKTRILDVELIQDKVLEIRQPGKVMFVEDGLPIVICGKGLLKITQLIDDRTGDDLLPLKRFRTRFS